MDEAIARCHTKPKKPASRHRVDGAAKESHQQLQIDAAATQYEAPGDEPLAVASRLTLEKPFRLDRDLVQRLRRRKVNAKEAFTIGDASGVYFRASLKECDERGGVALPYERMDRSPEPAIDITLACAVLARQRMLFVVQNGDGTGRRAHRSPSAVSAPSSLAASFAQQSGQTLIGFLRDRRMNAYTHAHRIKFP